MAAERCARAITPVAMAALARWTTRSLNDLHLSSIFEACVRPRSSVSFGVLRVMLKATGKGQKDMSDPQASERRIKVDYLARVEGEGALDVTFSDGQVT